MTSQDAQAQLDRFLDGLMDERERSEFEQVLASDAELQRAAALQKSIDASLSRAARPEAVEACLAALPLGRVTRSVPSLYRLAPLGIAAAVLAVLATWVWSSQSTPGHRPIALPTPTTLVAAYRQAIETGFRAYHECKDPSEYNDRFRERFGQGLVAAAPPVAVTLLGWGTSELPSNRAYTLLLKRDGKPVMLFFDELSADRAPIREPAADVHIYRREIGRMVVYEVTPFDAPVLLDSFRDPAGA